MKPIQVLFAFTALLLTSQTKADIVFQSGQIATTQAPVNAFVSDGNNNVTGTWAAVRFTLDAAIDIDSLMVEGLFVGGAIPASDLFTIAFFQDGITIPGAQISPGLAVENVVRTNTAVNAFGTQVYHFQMDLQAPLELAAGSYWLSVANSTPSNGATQSWYWTASANGTFSGAESPVSQTSGYTFSTDARTQVFSFGGTTVVVPEPSVSWLLLGVLGLAVIKRYRSKSKILKAEAFEL